MANTSRSSLNQYRGRIAPSPTGLMHLGHAATFWTAYQRAQSADGILVFRNEDLDPQRSKTEFLDACIEDLKWFGIQWQEGPDVGGPFEPYHQSRRLEIYRDLMADLIQRNRVYPCTCSRREIQAAAQAPHESSDEPVYPGTCRERVDRLNAPLLQSPGVSFMEPLVWGLEESVRFSLRFRVPDDEPIAFHDSNLGSQSFVCGKNFGDFVLWRHDGVPSYQLACVADDLAMQITEVVRGEDLLISTARQILMYRALNASPPAFHHCRLIRDEAGHRLAKRHDSLSLQQLKMSGKSPEELRLPFGAE